MIDLDTTTTSTDDGELLTAALDYAAAGIYVLPIHGIVENDDGDLVCTCGGRRNCKPGKHPATPNGLLNATTDPDTIRRWWARNPQRNIGINLGMSGIGIVDDDADDSDLASLVDDLGELDSDWVVTTGRGHHYYLSSGDVPIPTIPQTKLGTKVETKGEGGYAIAPPSRHATGTRYEWVKKGADRPPTIKPEWDDHLASLKSGKGTSNGTTKKVDIKDAPEDVRNFLEAVENVTPKPAGGWMVSCPTDNHENGDRHPSLAVGVGDDDKLLLNCFGGCEFTEILDAAFDDAGGEIATDGPPKPTDGLPEAIVWTDLWDYDPTDRDWLAEPLLPQGRLIALYAVGKAGKSLLALEIAAALATGGSAFGIDFGEPTHVTYLDFEMTMGDVQDRLSDLGYDKSTDLSRLHYYFQPPIPALDTAEGGKMLLALVKRDESKLVIVDTLIRSVEGSENDADTYSNAYRHSFMPLKREGITVLRLDHAGKDRKKGARGSSAKRDDVDVVWVMTANGTKIQVAVDAARINWVPQTVDLVRKADPLRHDWPTAGTISIAGQKVVHQLDHLKVPDDTSVRKAKSALQDAGEKAGTNALAEAVRFRKLRLTKASNAPKNRGAKAFRFKDGTPPNGTDGTPAGNGSERTDSEAEERSGGKGSGGRNTKTEHPRNTQSSQDGTFPPSIEGERSVGGVEKEGLDPQPEGSNDESDDPADGGFRL